MFGEMICAIVRGGVRLGIYRLLDVADEPDGRPGAVKILHFECGPGRGRLPGKRGQVVEKMCYSALCVC